MKVLGLSVPDRAKEETMLNDHEHQHNSGSADLKRPGIAYSEMGKGLEPCGKTKAEVHEIAETLVEKYRLEPAQDIHTGIVDKMRGRITVTNFDDWLNRPDTILVHGQGDFDILIGPLQSSERARFATAHELGHYVLHSDYGRIPIIATREGTGRIEWEANWFAAALLMPSRMFTDAWHRSKGDIRYLAVHFDVSYAAAEIRAKSLGLLSGG